MPRDLPLRDVLVFVEEYISLNGGVSPSQTDIADALGVNSRGGSTVNALRALEIGGYIRRVPHRNRAIEVLRPVRDRIPVYDAETHQLREYLP